MMGSNIEGYKEILEKMNNKKIKELEKTIDDLSEIINNYKELLQKTKVETDRLQDLVRSTVDNHNAFVTANNLVAVKDMELKASLHLQISQLQMQVDSHRGGECAKWIKKVEDPK